MEPKKNGKWPLVVMMILIGLYIVYGLTAEILKNGTVSNLLPTKPNCQVPQLVSRQDQNHNQVPDSIDIVLGAREEVIRGTIYDGAYYAGYPPEGRGACTDVIWRALAAAGYDLKKMVDEDIARAPAKYGATGAQPDPNIDFRRVSNLRVFFTRHAQQLTIEINPGATGNLEQWQAGDIVVFGGRLEHIGIISDKRGRDGVPLMIHNSGPAAREDQYYLTNWPTPISNHFRFIPLEDPINGGEHQT